MEKITVLGQKREPKSRNAGKKIKNKQKSYPKKEKIVLTRYLYYDIIRQVVNSRSVSSLKERAVTCEILNGKG